MPFINGRFYINPAYGRALEAARTAEAASQRHETDPQEPGAHWVTIDGRHVLIHETQAGRAHHPRGPAAGDLSARDKAYLDKYYDAVRAQAKNYKVDPALVLGVGIESGFASQGTYLRTGDAFGMTGGGTKHMTTTAFPAENVKQFFDNYGDQIRGTGSDASAFINALQGRDASGARVPGWKVYNTVNPSWPRFIGGGIQQMRRDIPIYTSQRTR